MVERTHKDWLEFLRKAAELPIGYSIDDLIWFKTIADRQYPALGPLVAACIYLAQQSNLAIAFEGPTPRVAKAKKTSSIQSAPQAQAPLFELFKDKNLFPKNSDLASFAMRAVPGMKEQRFDKMSRGDIAHRLAERIQGLSPQARDSLEASVREAVSHSPELGTETRSFVSKWASIIRDMAL